MTVVINCGREVRLMSGLRDPDSCDGQKTGVLSGKNRQDVESRLPGILPSGVEEGSRRDLIYLVGEEKATGSLGFVHASGRTSGEISHHLGLSQPDL